MFELLRATCDGKQKDDHVFTRDDGKPIKDFRGAWRNMYVRAGVGEYRCAGCGEPWQPVKEFGRRRCGCGSKNRKYKGLIPHDSRRSAAKALRRAGVPESVIMATGGWKTASMFRRYAIVSETDQRDAMLLLEKARAEARRQALTPLNPSAAITEPDATDTKGPSIQ